jgi:hypothetical protein
MHDFHHSIAQYSWQFCYYRRGFIIPSDLDSKLIIVFENTGKGNMSPLYGAEASIFKVIDRDGGGLGTERNKTNDQQKR